MCSVVLLLLMAFVLSFIALRLLAHFTSSSGSLEHPSLWGLPHRHPNSHTSHFKPHFDLPAVLPSSYQQTHIHWKHLLTYCRRPCHHSEFPSVRGASPVSFLSFYLVSFFHFFSSSFHSTNTVFTVSSLKEPSKISHPPRESGKISELLLAVPRVWRQLSRIEASNA